MDIREVVRNLECLGLQLSERTIRNYEKWELISKPSKEWFGRGKGSAVMYALDTPEQAYAAHLMLRTRALCIDALKYVRVAGLRMAKENLLGVTIPDEKVLVTDEGYSEYVSQIKEKVFFDVPSYWMLRYYGDVSYWAWLYLQAGKAFRGEINYEIPGTRKRGPIDKFLNKIFSPVDEGF